MELFVNLLKRLMYAFAVLLTISIIWCLAGCRSTQKLTKESVHQNKTDSSAFVQRVKLDTVKIPAASATASVPAKWLYDNPGTAYSTTSGRATVSVKLLHDTVQVQADCDSLQKVIASINTQLYHLQQQTTEKQTSEVVHTVKIPGQLQVIIWVIGIAVIGFLILRIVQFFKPL